jgi:hypothetical protein
VVGKMSEISIKVQEENKIKIKNKIKYRVYW